MEQINLKWKINDDGSITLNWSKITGAIRYHAYMFPIDKNYMIYNKDDLVVTSCTSKSGLEANKQYKAVVAAYSSNALLASDGTTILVHADFYNKLPLEFPKNIKATVSTATATIKFDKVDRASTYDILFDGTVYNVTNTFKQITGLKSKTTYNYAVRSKNPVRVSAYSPTKSITTLPKTPAVPGNVRKSVTETSVTLTWGAVSTATGYDVKFDGRIYSESGTTRTFTGLSSGTSYTYQISAKNADGASEYTQSTTATTAPYPPSSVSATSTSNSITVTWNPVKGATSYGLKLNGREEGIYDTSITYKGLSANTNYTYQVCSRCLDGFGAFSPLRTIRTLAQAPTIPGSTGIETTENSATVRWNAVPGALGYDLLFNGTTYSVNGTSKTFTGLTPDTSYPYQVRSKRADGFSEYSPEKTIRTTSRAPESSTGSTNENSVTVSWNPVPGATGYDVLFEGTVHGVSGTYKTITGLKPNTTYSYKIRAKNANGASSYGKEKSVKTTAAPPSSSSATATRDSAQISWDHTTGTTSYDVLINGTTYRTTSFYLNVNGLTPGTTYNYSIRANNADGSSSYCATKTFTTIPNIPGVPTNVRASVTADTATLSWNAVSGATSYDVDFGNGSYNVTGTSKTITGLKQGTEYGYAVRARNSGGAGLYSPWQTITTLRLPPGVPANIRATATTSTIDITWSATAGAAKYNVKLNNSVYTANGTTISFSNMTPNTNYSYAVCAVNSGGSSAYSPVANIKTLVAPPSMPANVSATATTNSITINWSAAGGATGYNIMLRGAGTIFKSTGTSITLNGLLANTAYYYAVAATNASGTSAYTKEQMIQTLAEKPAIPANVNAAATADAATVTWNTVQGAESYDVIFDNVVYNTPDTSRTFTGLISDRNYTYGVRAKNTAGASEYSQIKSVRTRLKVPENIRAIPEKNSVKFSWDPVTGATGYILRFGGAEYRITETTKELTDLTPDTAYSYSLCATNEHGSSDYSKASSVKTLSAIPKVPEGVYATSTFNSVTVYWNPVAVAESYTVEFDGETHQVSAAEPKSQHLRSAIKKPGDTSIVFTGLKPNTKHTYCVCASNEHGSSGYSPLKSIFTQKSKRNGLPNAKSRKGYLDGKRGYMGLDPVNAITGSFLWSYTYLEDYGKDALHFTVMYDSQRDEYAKALGLKWSHSMNYLLYMDEKYAYFGTPYDEVTPFLMDKENNSFQLEEDIRSSYTMEKNQDQTYAVKDADGTAYVFNNNLTLSRIIEGGLVSYQCSYDEEGQMIDIQGAHGSRLTFTYDNKKISGVTDRLGNSVQFQYQGEYLTFAGKSNGSGISFTYDEMGNLLKISDFSGQNYLTNQYDNQGRVRVQDTAGRGKSNASYNEIERLTVFTDEQGNQTKYRYDEQFHVTDVEIAGSGIRNKYDENGLLTEQTDSLGNTTQMEYDEYGRMTQVTHPDHSAEQIFYNDKNYPIHLINRDGTESFYEYDAKNNLISACDERGKICYYTYDTEDNLVSYTDKCEGIWTYQYDENHHLTQAKDPEGNVYGYSHDAVGRLLSHTTPGGKNTLYRYSEAGDLLEITDADGTMVFSYDDNGNQTAVTDRMGNQQQLEYNQMGQVTMATDFMGNQSHFAYDSRGNLIKETDPLGYHESYGYDALGNRTAYTDKNGRKTTYSFDAASQITQVKDAGDHVVQYTYDTMGQVQTVTDAMQNQTNYTYDLAGRVTKITNALGHSIEYAYDPCGNLLTKTDENGTVITYAYDNENRLSEMVSELGTVHFAYDALGRVVEILDTDEQLEMTQYDKDGNVTEQKDKEGNKKTYSYDASGKVSQITDSIGAVTAFAYDKNGNCTKVTDTQGNEYQYTYDANNRMVQTRNPLGHEVTYEYDARGDLISITDARGGKRTYTYDKNGNLIKEITPVRGTINYTYDDLNRLIKVEDEEYNKSFFEYDANGNMVSYTDPNQNSWEYRYDAVNRLIGVTDQNGGCLAMEHTKTGNIAKIVDQEGAQTNYRYDSMGRLLEMADALDHRLSWTYDSKGRIVTQTDAKGNTTRYGYSPGGNLLSITDGEENITRYTYDALGQILSETDPEGNEKTYEYDFLGQVISMTDKAGDKTSFTYTAGGEISTVTDAGGNITQYRYDPCGNLIEITDPQGTVTAFEYDAMNNQIKECVVSGEKQLCTTLYQYDKKGNVIREINPLSDQKIYSRDANGNITSIYDEEKAETTIRYDLNNLPVHMSHSDGKEAAFRYNKRGELVELKDWNGTVNLTYGKTGKLSQVTDHNGRTTGYSYDANGNVTAVVYPDGSTQQYEYDKNNRMKSATDPEGNATRFEYTGAGRIKTLRQPGSTAAFIYNQKGLPVKASYQFDDKTTAEDTFTYDPLGNMLSNQRTGSTPELTKQTAYTYDPLGQLLSVREGANTQTYVYDILGNRLSKHENGSPKASYEYDALNRLKEMVEEGARYSYGYDKRGGLTEERRYDKVIRQYSYDAAGRMQGGKNLETGETTSYTYNALSMRIKHVQKLQNRPSGYQSAQDQAGGIKSPYHTKEIQYVMDYLSGTNNELMSYEKGYGATRTVYGHGYERLSQKMLPEAGSQATPRGTIAAAIDQTFFQQDLWGSTLFAANKKGDILSYTEHDVWGTVKNPGREDLNQSGLEGNTRFTNYCYDGVIDKHYAQARFYDAGRGRMLSKDPVKRSLNGYPYCNNNPANYVDPTGEIPTVVAGGFLGGAIGGVFGFAGSAVSQWMSGEDFSLRKALGSAANGAVTGAVRGAIMGSGAGLGISLLSNFAGGAAGNALEQFVGKGTVDFGDSMVSGLTNMVSGAIYGRTPFGSVKNAFLRGAASGAATAGINNLYDAWKNRNNPEDFYGAEDAAGRLVGYTGLMPYGRSRDPRAGCGPSNPLRGGIGFRTVRGYRYVSGESQGRKQTRKRGFRPEGLIKDMLIGSVMGGLGGAAFYGADKAMTALRGSFGKRGGSDRYINGQRTSKYHELTDAEIASLKNDIRDIGADESIFRFNKGYQTGYSDKKGLIYVKGDVLPDVRSTHPRDLMSSKAVLAHEYYGHKNFGDLYGSRNPMAGAWNDEFRASYAAALKTPNLGEMDRMYLMSDALDRAKTAGVNIKITDTIRRVLYGY